MKFSLLPRKKHTDKRAYGHVLVLAGSRGMTGAALLSARAALASGSGLVTLGVPRSVQKMLGRSLVEAMWLLLPETAEGAIAGSSYSSVMRFIQKRKINSLAVGPGLSQNSQTAGLVRRVVQNAKIPVVLDADGLNSFRGRAAALAGHAAPRVLTPHRGEFERLFQESWPERKSRRLSLAKRVCRFYDVVLVLKGCETLVVSRDRQYTNRTGNPGMAKGGAGDVLTGIIASFIGQGLGPFEASVWAVYFHGKAGDLGVKKKGELSLLASDLIDFLPEAFKSRASLSLV